MPLSTEEYKEYFNDFSRDYDDVCEKEIAFVAPRISVSDILKILPEQREIRVYETGIGTGLVFEEFTKQAPDKDIKFYGTDLARKMIRKARKKLPKSHLKTLDANKDPLPWQKKSADISCSIGVFQYLSNKTFALQEMIRTTKKNGLVAISALSFRQTNDGSALKPTYEDTDENLKQGELVELMESQGLRVILDKNYVSYTHGRIDHFDNLVIAEVT